MPANYDPGSALPQPADTNDDTAAYTERAVLLPKHLHARPAGQVAQAAARHPVTTIELVCATRRANARSVLAVMALGAVAGNQIHVVATGPTAETATEEIVSILLAPED